MALCCVQRELWESLEPCPYCPDISVEKKTNTLPLHVEILYNEFQYVPAFAVSSILVILAVILLIARNVLEHKGKGGKRRCTLS